MKICSSRILDIVKWEEIKRHESELVGRHLRVTVKSDLPSGRKPSSSTIEKRLEALNAWLNLPRPAVTQEIDDSREGIYGHAEDRG
jgi:hypothetical protein